MCIYTGSQLLLKIHTWRRNVTRTRILIVHASCHVFRTRVHSRSCRTLNKYSVLLPLVYSVQFVLRICYLRSLPLPSHDCAQRNRRDYRRTGYIAFQLRSPSDYRHAMQHDVRKIDKYVRTVWSTISSLAVRFDKMIRFGRTLIKRLSCPK